MTNFQFNMLCGNLWLMVSITANGSTALITAGIAILWIVSAAQEAWLEWLRNKK